MNFGGRNSRFYLWFSYNNISNIRRKTVHISLNFIFKFPLLLFLDHKFLNLLRLNHNGRSWIFKFYLTKKMNHQPKLELIQIQLNTSFNNFFFHTKLSLFDQSYHLYGKFFSIFPQRFFIRFIILRARASPRPFSSRFLYKEFQILSNSIYFNMLIVENSEKSELGEQK